MGLYNVNFTWNITSSSSYLSRWLTTTARNKVFHERLCIPVSGKLTGSEIMGLYLAEWPITILNLSLVTDLEIGVTHGGRDKMEAMSQTTFQNAFSWMKMFKFRLIFHSSLFPRLQLTTSGHWFRFWPRAQQATSHYLNQWCPKLPTPICVTRLQ